MSRFWSSLTHDLKPYVPGEQPRMAELVKLNTNESPFGPSPRVFEAILSARSEVIIETFILFEDTVGRELHAAMRAAAQRGVKVDLMIDGLLGSPVANSPTPMSTFSISPSIGLTIFICSTTPFTPAVFSTIASADACDGSSRTRPLNVTTPFWTPRLMESKVIP